MFPKDQTAKLYPLSEASGEQFVLVIVGTLEGVGALPRNDTMLTAYAINLHAVLNLLENRYDLALRVF